MSTKVPTAVIWDMGGIVYRYFTEVVLERAHREGWQLEEVPLGPTGALTDLAYDDMAQGRINESAYLGIVEQRLADAGHAVDIRRSIHWPDQDRPATWELIDDLAAAGVDQALLTNDATAWLGERWWDTWSRAATFAAIVDVATLEARKPDPEPYLACARELGREPAACIFVDDMPVNCAGAEAVGMASHFFDIRDVAGSIDALARRLHVSRRAARTPGGDADRSPQ